MVPPVTHRCVLFLECKVVEKSVYIQRCIHGMYIGVQSVYVFRGSKVQGAGVSPKATHPLCL